MSRRWHAEKVLQVLTRRPGGATTSEIARVAGDESDVQSVGQSCRVLAKVGLVERAGDRRYRLTALGRGHAGKEYRTGQSNGLRQRRGLWRRVWYVIRARRKFTVQDLFELADLKPVDERKVRYYLTLLTRAGYLVPMARGVRSPAGATLKRWFLVTDTGPAHPVWRTQRRELYDPNSGRVVYSADAEGTA